VTLTLSAFVAHSALADKSTARQAYDKGVKQYNLGEYEAALKAFTDAYDEFPDPTLLYNLAQCQRQLGHRQKAITLYKSYLRETDGKTQNAGEVKRLIALLEQDVAREEAAKKQPSSSTPPQDAQTAAPSPANPSPFASTPPPVPLTAERHQTRATRTLKVAGIAAGAAGVALVAVGGAFFGVAKSANDSYLHPADGTYSAAAEDRRVTYNVLDKTFVIAGGVAIAAGATMVALGVKKSNSWSLRPAVSKDRASLYVSFRF
jgi:tetratricopeptide (TPR) repeat protein